MKTNGVAKKILRGIIRIFLQLRFSPATAILVQRIQHRNYKTLFGFISQRMAYVRDSRLTEMADKINSKLIALSKVPSLKAPKTLKVFSIAEDLKSWTIPRHVVFKVNHSSGGVVVVSESAPKGNLLPTKRSKNFGKFEQFHIHPDSLNKNDLANLMFSWVKKNYYWGFGRHVEWTYKNIPRKVFAEEFIGMNAVPMDYKFMMVQGKCVFIQVDDGRYIDHRRSLFTTTWEPIPVVYDHPHIEKIPMRPVLLPEMLKVAEELSDGIGLLRVDLYVVGDEIYFGELTNYPDGGYGNFTPKSYDALVIEPFREYPRGLL